MRMNKTKPYLKVYLFSINFLFLTFLIGQEEMSSEWVNISDESPDKVKVLIRDATRTIKAKSSRVIDEAKEKIEDENDRRAESFTNRKIDLRSSLNDAINEKNSIAMTVNDLDKDFRDKQTQLKNYQQKISDADSSIANSKQLIQEEKDRVLDELTKIPFYEVLIGKVENLPQGENPIAYENAIASKISREAIVAQLGVDIIKQTIIQDGLLSNESILTLLKGKANTQLTRVKKQREDQDNNVFFDLYRYGLVTVYPFQEDDIILTKTKELGISVKVEAVISAGEGMSEVLDRDGIKKLRNMINEKKSKNSDSKSQVTQLARTVKQVIRKETANIKASERTIADYKEKIAKDTPDLNNAEKQILEYLEEQQIANTNFITAQKAWNGHVVGEEHVEVIPGMTVEKSRISMEDQFSEIAANTYEDFITSIKSEYLMEETELTGETLSEINKSKKSDIKLNRIKIIGKFSEEGRTGKINLIVYVAYNFGFQFEQPGKPLLSESITPTFKTIKRDSPKESFNLNITSVPSGAVVKSGRKKLGKTPLQLYLEPGLHSLVINKKGYKTAMEVLEVNNSGVLLNGSKSHFVLQAEEKESFNKIYLYGGIAIIGGGAGLYLLTRGEDGTAKETGSVSLTIEIP